MYIKDNIYLINNEISKHVPAGKQDDVTLIAVSKTHPADMIMEAYEAGCRDFGENKVQELVSKYDILPDDIRWHLIGHLQTNKVKQIIDKVYMIHSVDSFHLAEKINSEAEKINKTINVLIEVNVSGEESKFGVKPVNLTEFVRSLSGLRMLNVCGLMTVAPYTPDAENNRRFFSDLRKLSIDINSLNLDNINVKYLSMGMSGDYTVALEEGANMIRIGTGIFGEREYLSV